MKEIRLEKIKIGDLKTGFGNPRKITRKKQVELTESLQVFGDFGVFVIDEENNLISGSQRARALLDSGYTGEVDCKRLVGYTEQEKKIINVKCNQHAGEWDLDILAEWISDVKDIVIDDVKIKNEPEVRSDIGLQAFEKYDYVVIVCRSEIDYNELTRKLNIDNKKTELAGKKKLVKARAVWYEEFIENWH